MSNMAIDAKACFSSKVEYRAVIRYLYLKGKTGKEIHGELAGLWVFCTSLCSGLNSGQGNSNAVERL